MEFKRKRTSSPVKSYQQGRSQNQENDGNSSSFLDDHNYSLSSFENYEYKNQTIINKIQTNNDCNNILNENEVTVPKVYPTFPLILYFYIIYKWTNI